MSANDTTSIQPSFYAPGGSTGSSMLPQESLLALPRLEASPNASTRAILDELVSFEDLNRCEDCEIRDRHALPPSIVAQNKTCVATTVGSRHEAFLQMERLPRRGVDEVIVGCGTGEEDIEAGLISSVAASHGSGQRNNSCDGGIITIKRAFWWSSGPQKTKSLITKDRRPTSRIAFNENPFQTTSLRRRRTTTTFRETKDSRESCASEQEQLIEVRDPRLIEKLNRKSVSMVTTTKRKASRSLSKTLENIGDLGKKTQKGLFNIFRKDSGVSNRSLSVECPLASGALPNSGDIESEEEEPAVDDEERLANYPYQGSIGLPDFRLPSPLTGIVTPHYSFSSELSSTAKARDKKKIKTSPTRSQEPDEAGDKSIVESLEPLVRMKSPIFSRALFTRAREPVRAKSKVEEEIEEYMGHVRKANFAVTPPTKNKKEERRLMKSNQVQILKEASIVLNRAEIGGKFETSKIQQRFDKALSCDDLEKQRAASISFREESGAEQQLLHKEYLEVRSRVSSVNTGKAALYQGSQQPASDGRPASQYVPQAESVTGTTKTATDFAAVAGVMGNTIRGSAAPMMLA